MILLSGHSLTPEKKIPLESMSLQLRERNSTATITPADVSGISVNSWLMDDTEPGAGIVWRVRSIENVYSTRTPKVQLEHVINTLGDRLLFGDITPATITGTEGATTCTARQAVDYILSQQSDWTLQGFDYGSVSAAYKFDGDSLLDALMRVTETLENAWWSYDTTVYPFKLSIKAKASGVACELKPGRNLTAISKTIDRTGMYTRFYPIGKADLHISGDYVQKNTSSYGVVSKVETDSTIDTEAGLIAWANERLNKHAEPRVTITADGLELVKATGEPLDRLKLGRICRAPLTEYGTTISERIVELNYPEKIRQPEVVRITMGNEKQDIARLIADEIKNGAGPSGAGRGGGGGRGGGKKEKEDMAWFEDTDEHVAMVAKGIIGEDAEGNANWTRLAQMIVDGTGIHAGVKDFIGELEHFQSDFQMNESKISLVVGRYNNQNYIKAGEITLAINQSTGESEAKIDADHVYIGNTKSTTVINGKLNTDELASKIALLNAVAINTLNIQTLIDAPLITGTEGLIDSLSCDYLSLSGSAAFDDCIVSASKNAAGDELTLTYASGDTLTFNKAAPASGVSSSWSGNQITVTANPNGSDRVRFRVTASCTYDSTNNRYVAHAHADGAERDTDYLAATSAYNAGYNAALSDAGVANGGTVYTGSWYNGTLYAMPQQGSATYTNCVTGATGHRLTKK